jgi:3-hydroxyisobutyrate dehydrogenase-like beta-hydroxyacid dehydrogenase
MTRKPTVGWIGLGKLGLPIATRLVEAGYSVTGDDTVPARLALAAERGITPAANLEAAASRDIVFTCLPDDKALLSATLGESGILASMRPGGILVEASTVSPHASAAYRATGRAGRTHDLRRRLLHAQLQRAKHHRGRS